jgi:hypothetical protein
VLVQTYNIIITLDGASRLEVRAPPKKQMTEDREHPQKTHDIKLFS